MGIITRIVTNALVVLILSKILPGVQLSGFGTALIVAIVLGLVNAFVKPILVFISLPINILTLGLFMIIINAILVLIVSALVPGFSVTGFGWAILIGISLSFINSILP